MKWLLVAILTVAGLWSGYWVVGSAGFDRGLRAWIEARQDEGWVAEYGALDVRGFPNRFDTVIEDLTLADPETGVAWTAPQFSILALSYQPNEIVAIWPPEQTLASPFQTLTITSEDLRASAGFEAGTALTLDRSTVEMVGVNIASTLGWDATLANGLLALRQTAAAVDSYDLFFEASDFRPDRALRLGLDPTGGLPEALETFQVDMTMGFDAPWDRFAIEDRRPQPVSLDLRKASAKWGQLDLRAAGSLTIDARGRPEGQITIKATNWREMLDLGVASGLVPEGLVPTLTRGLELLASLAGPANTIDAPLTFQRGVMSVGPFPIGPAPIVRLR